MKKKVCSILLIIFIICGITNQVSAAHITDLDISIFHNDKWGSNETGKVGMKYYKYKHDISTNKSVKDNNGDFITLGARDFILDILKQQYGYTGEIKSEILIETNITITKINILGKYDVYIGKDYEKDKSKFGGVIKGLNLDELRSKLGYIGIEPKEGDKWDVKIKVECPIDFRYGQFKLETDGNYHENVDLTGVELWSWPDMNRVNEEEILKDATDVIFESTPLEEDIVEDVKDFVEDKVEDVKDFVKDKVADIMAEFFGKLFMLILDFFRAIPDALQRGVNSVGKIDTIEAQTSNAEPEEITAPYTTIQADGNKNKRANVTLNEENKGDPNKQEIISLNEEEENFSENTEIPIIPLDMYNIVYGKVDFLDANFFKVNKTKHKEGSKWMFIRKIFAGSLHIMIYLCIGFLIAVLIINGIIIVKGTMIPEKKKEHLDGLRRFLIALFMLIGTVIIMNLCIYGTNALIKALGNAEDGDAFFRVNIEGDTNYSFNANLTEFVRFMTQINTVEKIGDKVMYIFLYFILVLANILTLGVMLVRNVFIVILSVQGPIVATAYSIEKKVFNMTYSDWVKKYIKWSMVQVILMIGYLILIKVAKF